MTTIRRKRKLSKKEVKARKKEQEQGLKKPVNQGLGTVLQERRVVEIDDPILVRDFASLLNVPVTELIKVLLKNGLLATINDFIDWETAAIVGDEFGYDVKVKKKELKNYTIAKSEERDNLVSRPPVVTVMGHIDHGKTLLLDRIRKTDTVSTESGGITQHIGAYQIHYRGKKITFIDTPGHESFETMRAHGVSITDIVVLVVAADKGVQPQTLEAYHHAQKAGVPIIVAINKIDLPQANIQKTKQQLSKIGLVPEDMGGKTICVAISAKQNLNIEELLEMILLVAEMQELKASFTKPAFGTIVESHLDPNLGPMATLLIRDGILKEGDFVVAGNTWGRIRLIEDEHGKRLNSVGPSQPVKIAGLKAIPSFGEVLQVVKDEDAIQQVLTEFRKMKPPKRVKTIINKKKIYLILKADVLGSLVALLETIKKLETDRVAVEVVRQGVGNITDDDIMFAKTVGADVFGFRVKAHSSATRMAEREKINVHLFMLIYELVEVLKKKIDSTAEREEAFLGRSKLLKIFSDNLKGKIVGIKMLEGVTQSGVKVIINREQQRIGEGNVLSVQIGKESVEKVEAGSLAGLKISTSVSLKEGDILEFYNR